MTLLVLQSKNVLIQGFISKSATILAVLNCGSCMSHHCSPSTLGLACFVPVEMAGKAEVPDPLQERPFSWSELLYLATLFHHQFHPVKGHGGLPEPFSAVTWQKTGWITCLFQSYGLFLLYIVQGLQPYPIATWWEMEHNPDMSPIFHKTGSCGNSHWFHQPTNYSWNVFGLWEETQRN